MARGLGGQGDVCPRGEKHRCPSVPEVMKPGVTQPRGPGQLGEALGHSVGMGGGPVGPCEHQPVMQVNSGQMLLGLILDQSVREKAADRSRPKASPRLSPAIAISSKIYEKGAALTWSRKALSSAGPRGLTLARCWRGADDCWLDWWRSTHLGLRPSALTARWHGCGAQWCPRPLVVKRPPYPPRNSRSRICPTAGRGAPRCGGGGP